MVRLIDIKKLHDITYAPFNFNTRMSMKKKGLKEIEINSIVKAKTYSRRQAAWVLHVVFTR